MNAYQIDPSAKALHVHVHQLQVQVGKYLTKLCIFEVEKIVCVSTICTLYIKNIYILYCTSKFKQI